MNGHLMAWGRPILVVILILSSLTLIAPTSVKAPGSWNTEVVEDLGDVGYYPSIAVDSENRIHIAYADRTNLRLNIAHQNGSQWDVETIVEGVNPTHMNLLLDGSGVGYLAYYDRTNGVLRFAVGSTGSWQAETVDSDVYCQGMESVSMDLDTQMVPHLAYCNLAESGNYTLVYANKSSGMWKSEVVDWIDGFAFSGQGISIALDRQDVPHVMWHGFGNLFEIRLHSRSGISWNYEVVHDFAYSGPEFFPYMAIGLDGLPRLSYGQVGSPYDGNMDLRYASKVDSSWMFETPDVGVLSPTGEVGQFSKLAFDSFGSPYMSYREGGGGFPSEDLFHAYWTGFGWDVEIVDSGIVNQWISIVVDHCNMPHVAYAEFSDGFGDANLKHAWKSCSIVMPDLTLTRNDISFSPPSPVENGTSVQINATIHNIGMTNVTNATVRFYNGAPHPIRQIGGDQTIPFIRYGLSDTTGITWVAQPEGTHDICVVVDPDNQIDEMNEMNNAACRTIEVFVPLPDLDVSQDDISFNQSTPFQNGSSVQIIATVHNIGGADAINVSVRFLDNPFGQIGGDEALPSISVAGSEILEKEWNATPLGSHEICVIADPEDQIMELDESNNEACVVVEVAEMSIPSPPLDLNAVLSGIGAMGVALSWSLSPDDGAGLGNVVRYDVHRGTTYDGSGASHPLHASVSNGTSSFVDVMAGEGDPNDYFYRVCATSSANLSSCAAQQAGKFTRPLSPGPSLISIPLIQSNESIETVLQTVEYDKAWSYNSASQEWQWHMKSKTYRRGLWNIDHTSGIWVNVTSNGNLTVAGVIAANTSIRLHSGWNMVGFPSFNLTYPVADLKAATGVTRVEGYFAPGLPHCLRVIDDFELLQAGYGYWVYVDTDTDWVVKVS